ncbi:MAG: hypothetical protein P8X74_05435 [Reinekea sp.]
MDNEGIAKSKLFYDGLLPGNIVRLSNYSYAMIQGVSNNDEEARAVDADQLLSVARRVISQWGELQNTMIDPGLERALEYPDEIVIVAPDGVYVDPFPMLLSCNVCGRLDYHMYPASDSDKRSAAKRRIRKSGSRSYIPCGHAGCKGRMKQIKLVAIHRCGALVPLQTPPGARRAKNLKYQASGGGVFQSNFIDMDNGDQFYSLQPNCRSCSSLYPETTQINLRATPVTNKDRLYPKNIQYLCLREDTGKMLANAVAMAGGIDSPLTPLGMDVAQGVASVLLNLSEGRGQALVAYLRERVGIAGPDAGEIERITKALKDEQSALEAIKATSDPDSPVIKTVINTLEEKIQALETELKRAQGEFSEVDEYIDNEDILTALVTNRRALESALLAVDFAKERATLEHQLSLAATSFERDELIQTMAILKSAYGVAEVAHYRQINVVMASLGYTRELSSPPEGNNVPPVVLMPYQDTASSRYNGKQIFYALPAQTEAIQLKLDPCAVLRWCVDHVEWENPGDYVTDDPVRAKAHLLTNSPALTMNPEVVISRTRDRPLKESAPFHLLHSISHSLLATIKPHTGYDEKSIMEYLLPMDLSILLYVTSVQNYTAGGLLTLFHHHLKAWFDDASNFALTCVFDPICSDRGAACSGCIQEVLGCETFNHGMSRSYLHGGMLDAASMLSIPEGFWS